MIEKSDRNRTADLHPDAPKLERLDTARGTLADVAHHTAREVQAACRLVLELGDDPEERAEAEGLLSFLSRGRETSR